MYAQQAKYTENQIDSYIHQAQFMNVLFHDAKDRGGYFGRFQFGELADTKWSAAPHKLMTDPATCDSDVYITVNSFQGKNKLAKDFFTLNAFFIDLDFHDEDKAHELSYRINNTLALLKWAEEKGVFPRPTMITKTGRGLGLFYVLGKTIANTDATAKQVNYWKSLYQNFADKLENILLKSKKPVLELDRKVIADAARVCRMPGTYNSKTGTMCTVYAVYEQDDKPVYYSLDMLKTYIDKKPKNKQIKATDPDKTKEKKVISFDAARKNPMLFKRAQKLERAQNVFRCSTGNRELLCFYYYNTLVPLYSREEAISRLYEYNNGFESPVPESEIRNIISSCAKATDLQGNVTGYYCIKESTMVENLELKAAVSLGKMTQAQYDYIGLGMASKASERAELTRRNKEKKAQRNARIIEILTENPDKTYSQVADDFGLSEITIKRIAKAAGFSRYEQKVQNTLELSEPSEQLVPTMEPAVQAHATDESIIFRPYIYNAVYKDNQDSNSIYSNNENNTNTELQFILEFSSLYPDSS